MLQIPKGYIAARDKVCNINDYISIIMIINRYQRGTSRFVTNSIRKSKSRARAAAAKCTRCARKITRRSSGHSHVCVCVCV